MAKHLSSAPRSAPDEDVAAQLSSVKLNSSIVRRQRSKEQAVLLTYSRLRSLSDYQQQKPRASSHTSSHGLRRSLGSSRHSPKVLKKASWVGESVDCAQKVTRVGAVKELSQEILSPISESSSGYDSPPIEARKFRCDRFPKRISGVGEDRVARDGGLYHDPAKKGRLFDGYLSSGFDTLTLCESVSPLAKVITGIKHEIVTTEDDDDGVGSWSSSLEHQPGDGCVDETDTAWSDNDDLLSNLSTEGDDCDSESVSFIQLDNEFECSLEPPNILPEIPLCSPLKRKQFLASCSPTKVTSPIRSSESTRTLTSCQRKLSVDYRLPKRSQSLTFPTPDAQSSVPIAPVQSNECLSVQPGTVILETSASPMASSLFPNVPPSIYFPLADENYAPLPFKIQQLLKWKMSPITPNIIKQCIARVGFTKAKSNRWLGYWGKHLKSEAFKYVKPYQKVNHFPGTFQIGRKDRLWRTLSRMQSRFKKDYDFFPKTYILPADTLMLRRDWDETAHKKWILKPPASARGIGIRVIHKWSQIPKKKPVVVQKYLSNPFLINGSKFDLRVYVYVTSYDPLRVYVFKEGLARFATCKYSTSMKSLSNRFIHLTNYSINKQNSSFTPNADETICQGHKWGLLALWSYMETTMGIDTTAVWESIKSLVIKTIIASEPAVTGLLKAHVKNRSCCHELFGFDVMLDKKLKPWILEVNISPSLHSSSQLDVNIKGQMVRDIFNMSRFPIPNEETFLEGQQDVINSLSPTEKSKHIAFIQKYRCLSSLDGILDDLTDDDIRIIMETEDELNRCGMFERVFPSSNSLRYHQFFDIKRYYNLLLQEWVNVYHKHPMKGIGLIRRLSKARNILY